jgi:hypothetical protein
MEPLFCVLTVFTANAETEAEPLEPVAPEEKPAAEPEAPDAAPAADPDTPNNGTIFNTYGLFA